MRGHVKERSPGTWRLHVYVGRDPVTKTSKYVTKTVKGTRIEAEAELANLLVEVNDGHHQATPGSVNELLDRWLAFHKPRWSPTTYRNYRGTAERHIRPHIGTRPLRKLRAVDIDDLYATLADAGIGQPTIRKTHVALHAALEQAVRWQRIVRNPADTASPPPDEEPDIVIPDIADLARLIAAAAETDPELATIIQVLATTGIRRGECCALAWDDIDLDKGTLLVHRAVVNTGNGKSILKSTKTRRARRIALDEDTVDMLRTHRARMAERAIACGVPLGAYVFSSDPACRKWLGPSTLSARWASARKAAGLDGLRLHSLRHWSISHAIAAGVDIKTVSARAGHARGTQTLNRYSHFLPTPDRTAASTVGGILRDAKKKSADG